MPLAINSLANLLLFVCKFKALEAMIDTSMISPSMICVKLTPFSWLKLFCLLNLLPLLLAFHHFFEMADAFQGEKKLTEDDITDRFSCGVCLEVFQSPVVLTWSVFCQLNFYNASIV